MLLFYRANRRIKDAEADKAHIEAMALTVKQQSEEIKRINDRLTDNEKHLANTEKRLIEKDKLLGTLYRTIENLTTSLHLYAMAVAKGLICTTPPDRCPIRKELSKSGLDIIKNVEYDKEDNTGTQRVAEQQPGEHQT